MRKLILLFLVATAFGQNGRYDNIAWGPKGPVPFASIGVCSPQPANVSATPCTPLASLCSSLTDTGCTSPNPVTADFLGNYHFYIKNSAQPFTVQIFGPQVASPFVMVDQFTAGVGTVAGNITVNGGSVLTNPVNLQNSGSVTVSNPSGSNVQFSASGGGGGGNPQLENCTPDGTGNSFYGVTSLTAFFSANWQFVFNTTTYFNCTVYIPSAQTGATVAVDVWSSDATAGHTASITYADGVINSGTINIGSLTAASPQTFTTTGVSYNRATLTFNVQSGLSNGSILVVKIGTAPTGTAPTANLNVWAHFIL
jgi:hypothetical protein